MTTHSSSYPKSDNRIEIRIDSGTKKLLEKGAVLMGFQTLSAYLRYLAIQTAKKDINDYHALELTQKDWLLFCNAIEMPPSPNAALTQAASKFIQKYGKTHR